MGTEITKYEDAWQAVAKRETERMRADAGGLTITTAGGVFKVGDDPVAGNALCVVVLDAAYVNAYYKGKWEAGQEVTPPHCFAMSLEKDELAPHPSMESAPYFEAQSSDCAKCPMNQYGTADVGKGKACKNRMRLALIDAGSFVKVKGTRSEWQPEIIEEEDHYRDAPMMYLNVPPTSMKAFQRYVKQAAEVYGRPTSGLITRIDSKPMGTGGFELTFETLEQFPAEYYPTLSARHAEATEAVLKPFAAPDAASPKEQGAAGVSRLKGLRKG